MEQKIGALSWKDNLFLIAGCSQSFLLGFSWNIRFSCFSSIKPSYINYSWLPRLEFAFSYPSTIFYKLQISIPCLGGTYHTVPLLMVQLRGALRNVMKSIDILLLCFYLTLRQAIQKRKTNYEQHLVKSFIKILWLFLLVG